MRHKFLQRSMGIFLAGLMCLNNSAVLAAETAADTIPVEEIQSEQTDSDQEEPAETDTEITENPEIKEDTEGTSDITDSISNDSDATEDIVPLADTSENTEIGGAPAAPADLEITGKTGTTVTLSWPTVANCTGYQVYRRKSGEEAFSKLGEGTIETTSNTVAYTDTTCELGQLYEYAVTAYKTVTVEENEQKLESAYSNVVDNATPLTGITLGQNDLQMNKGDKRTVKVSYEPDHTTDDRTVIWTSSNPSVVKVEAKEVNSSEVEITAVGAGEATITAAVGGKTASCKVTVKAPLASISLNKAKLTLESEKTDILMVSYDPSDTTDGKTVTWKSSDSNIVEVKANEGDSSKATITAHGKGTATITATVGGKTASCEVTVRVPAKSITLEKTYIELKAADDTLEGKNSAEVKITVTPGDTTDEITWEAADASLVNCVITGSGTERILSITPTEECGETQITVKAGNKKAILSVNITPDGEEEEPEMLIPVNAVVIDKTGLVNADEDEDEDANGAIRLQLGVNGTLSKEIKAECLPENATNQTLTWTSSNQTVASVSGEGGTATVTARGVGSAVITATADNGVSDSVNVVVQRSDDKISIKNETEIVLYCNVDKLAADIDKAEIKAEHIINMKKLGLTYEYHSSNSDTAVVDKDGKITAKAPGKADITVLHRESGSTAVVKVTVKRLVEKIILPQTEKTEADADAVIMVATGKTIEIPLSLLPGTADGDCLNTIAVSEPKNSNLRYKIDGKGASRKLIITALKKGDTKLTITAGDPSAEEEPIVSANFILSVHAVDDLQQVNTIKLTGTNKMPSSTTQELRVIMTNANRDEIDRDESEIILGFSSSNEEVATVDGSGKVTALKGGKTTITAYALDGSNKKATYAITVEQRPDSIRFDRETYGISRPAKTTTLKLTPLFSPSSTAASMKKVTWEIIEITDEKGEEIKEFADYFTVNTSGVVTVKNKAVEGMRATVRCTSAAYAEESVFHDITVLIQPKRVKTLKFDVSAPQLVGLQEHDLKFITIFEKDASQNITYQAASSDEEIATVSRDVTDGAVKLTAKKYGTVTITLCADNAVTTSCKVTIRPLEKGKKIAAKSARYLIQQTKFDANDKVKLEFVDAGTKKEVIDPKLFTYKSSDSNTVYVDEAGVAYVNPGAIIPAKGKEVTITASLTEDPDKRKATTKVKVCGENQIARMDVKYYASIGDADSDTLNTGGRPLADGMTMKKGAEEKKFVLRVMPCDAQGRKMEGTDIKVESSDTSRAKVSKVEAKKYTENNKKYYAFEVTVSVQKPGKFSITATAKDETKVSRKLDFGAYDGMPILVSAGLGTINKNSNEQIKIENKGTGIAAQSDFILLGANGTTIRRENVRVKEATVKVGKNETKKLNGDSFVIRPDVEDTDAYRLFIDKTDLSKIVPGTYKMTLQVIRSALAEESGIGIGSGTDVQHEITTTFTVVDTMPKFSDAKVTLNTFIKGDTVKIPFNTTWKQGFKILDIEPEKGLAMTKEIDIINDGIDWYVRLKESEFESWKKTSTSGTLKITLEGYDKPVTMRLVITTKSTKPVIKQEATPSVHLEYDRETAVTLVDAKKNVYSGYDVSLKETKPNDAYTVEAHEGKVKVSFKEDEKLKPPGPKGVTYKQTIKVKKPEWRDSVDVPISVKAYSGTSIPTVSFANSTLYINRYSGVEESSAETAVRISHSNIELQKGEWEIPTTYKYDNKKNDDNKIAYDYADVFKAEYENGMLKISLRDGADKKLQNTTYTFKMKGLELDKKGTQLPPIKETAQIKVVVRTIAPAVTVKMSGKLDLINRSTSTLKGTVTVKNVNSSVKRIDLGEELQKNYYCTRKDNTFTLYARSNAVLTTARVTGDIAITMTDGKVLYTKITFTPTQSTPKIGTPKPLTIYKSAASQTVDYDFNADITKGVKVESVETITLPEGLKVQESGGHLFVTLQNKTLKAGTYTIKVNLYLKGAQAVNNSPKGKAVQKTINVIVKE